MLQHGRLRGRSGCGWALALTSLAWLAAGCSSSNPGFEDDSSDAAPPSDAAVRHDANGAAHDAAREAGDAGNAADGSLGGKDAALASDTSVAPPADGGGADATVDSATDAPASDAPAGDASDALTSEDAADASAPDAEDAAAADDAQADTSTPEDATAADVAAEASDDAAVDASTTIDANAGDASVEDASADADARPADAARDGTADASDAAASGCAPGAVVIEIPAATTGNSGNFNTLGAVCVKLHASVPQGWGVSNGADRTLTVQGATTIGPEPASSAGGGAIPAGSDGYVYWNFSASASVNYTSIYFY